MHVVSIDLCAKNVSQPVVSIEEWLNGIENHVANASSRRTQMFVLPEYACAQWLNFASRDMLPTNQLAWLAENQPLVIERLSAMAIQYRIAILPGTLPVADDREKFRNRAYFLSSEGDVWFQDKLSLTPSEVHGTSGTTVPGKTINVISWQGLRVAIVVCLDVEYTALWHCLGALNLDLVIVPAMTKMITGYNRVSACARARAIELQTVVCVVGAVGTPLTPPHSDLGVGGASVFLPCDVSVSLDGILAATPPLTSAVGNDHILSVPNIPVGLCKKIRTGLAEAEKQPAAWPADHLEILENTPARKPATLMAAI